MDKKILFLATVDSHIYYFHIPFMKLLKKMGYDVEVAAAPVDFKEKIEKDGFKVYSVPFSKNPLSFSNLKSFFMIFNLMKKEKYIMVHTHTPVASFLGRVAAKMAGVPHIVYTAHGFHFHEYGSKLKNFLYYRLEKFAGKFTDVLITINPDDYKIAIEKNLIPDGKVVYIKGVGVDLEKFSPEKINSQTKIKYRGELHIKENDFVLITIAELTKRKNVIDIIKALRVVNSWGKSVQLLVVGDGPLRDELRNFLACDDLIKGRVFFLGKRFDIPELLSISDLFVMTSYHEGLPRAMMEAMSMKRPIVAYNIRGVRDLVEDSVNGFLVPFGDVKALSEKIKYLLEHPDIVEEMGKKGRERIEKEFSLDVVLHQMEVLYKEILESEYN